MEKSIKWSQKTWCCLPVAFPIGDNLVPYTRFLIPYTFIQSTQDCLSSIAPKLLLNSRHQGRSPRKDLLLWSSSRTTSVVPTHVLWRSFLLHPHSLLSIHWLVHTSQRQALNMVGSSLHHYRRCRKPQPSRRPPRAIASVVKGRRFRQATVDHLFRLLDQYQPLGKD